MLTRMYSDKGIMQKVLRGQLNAFGVLVDRYGQMVYGVAYARLGNRFEAEEVTQDVFVRLYQWLDRVSQRRSIGPWLVEVARNAATDAFRKRMREVPLDSVEEQPVEAHDAVRDETARVIWEQLARLSEEQREILILRYFQDMHVWEIGRHLGVSRQLAAKRLQRARDELGKKLMIELGRDLAGMKKEAGRRQRVLRAVAAAPTLWKPSAALSLAGAAITGGSAVKTTAVAAVALLVLLAFYGGWRYWQRPSYSTQDITRESQFVKEPIAPETGRGAAPTVAPRASVESVEEGSGPVQMLEYGTIIHGVVLNEQLLPVPEAAVTLSATQTTLSATGISPGEGRPLFTTSSDASGRFECAVALASRYPLNSYEALEVSAEAGALYGSKSLSSLAVSRKKFVELVLQPVAAVAGEVVDESGRGVADATLFFHSNLLNPDNSCKTAADGSFRLPHLAPATYRFTAGAEGFLPTQQECAVTLGGKHYLVFQLLRGNWIEGRVIVGEDAQPLAGITVEAHNREIPRLSSLKQGGYGTATTDGQGAFRISGLAAGSYEVRLKHMRDGLRYVVAEAVTVRLLADKPVRGVLLRATAGASVSGRVLDDATGQPIADALVWFTRKGSDFVPGIPDSSYADIVWCTNSDFVPGTTRSDGAGAYTVAPLEAGDYRVIVRTPEQSELETALSVAASKAMEGVDLRVSRLPAVRGKVVNQDNQPVAGATIAALAPEARPIPTTSTDGRGEFAVYLPRTVKAVYLQAYGDGVVSRQSGLAKAGSYEVLTLGAAGRIEGTVVDRRHRPVPECVVSVVSEDKTGSPLLSTNGVLMKADNKAFQGMPTKTSCSGTFEVDPILPGSYRLDIYFRSSVAGYPVASARVSVEAGQTLRTQLTVDTDGFGRIEGSVTSGGLPAAGFVMLLSSGSSAEKWVDTVAGYPDGAGHYAFDQIRPGLVVISVQKESASGGTVVRHETTEIAAGETKQVDINLAERDCGIEGTITMDGQGAGGVSVVVTPLDNPEAPPVTAVADFQGNYRMTDLQEGVYRLEIKDRLHHYVTRAVSTCEIKKDEMGRHDFALESGQLSGTISGLREDEKALVAVFDQAVDLDELSAMSPELRSRVLASVEVVAGESFEFRLEPGWYFVGCIAVPASSAADETGVYTSLGKGRYQVVQAEIVSGQSTPADMNVE